MTLSIDLKKCTKCGFCEKVCPAYIIEIKNDYPIEKFPEDCIECGHCVAVCPVDAIIHKNMDLDDFKPIINSKISFDQFNNLSRNRRSSRRYQKKQIPDEILNKIMDSVRYIPTASNAQELKYLVINNQEQLNKIRFEMEKKLAFIGKFIPKYKMRLEKSRIDRKNGIEQDIFLRTARCFIIIYSKGKGKNWDAGIAAYHIALAAKTLGLGSCIIGYHIGFSRLFKTVRTASLIPKKHKVFASIGLGYPNIKYKKTCSRKPIDVKII